LSKDSPNSSNNGSGETQIYSFLVRVWKEELSLQDSQTVWRGHVTRIPDGTRRYFKDFNEIADLMMAQLKSQT